MPEKRPQRKLPPETVPRPGGLLKVPPARPTRTTKYYHKYDDLAKANVSWSPRDAAAKGPTSCKKDDISERLRNKRVNRYDYTTWAQSTMPLSDVNRNLLLDATLGLLVKLATGRCEGLTHASTYQPVQFLKTVLDDRGQPPPNILAFLEYVDFLTKDDGTEPAEKPN